MVSKGKVLVLYLHKQLQFKENNILQALLCVTESKSSLRNYSKITEVLQTVFVHVHNYLYYMVKGVLP